MALNYDDMPELFGEMPKWMGNEKVIWELTEGKAKTVEQALQNIARQEQQDMDMLGPVQGRIGGGFPPGGGDVAGSFDMDIENMIDEAALNEFFGETATDPIELIPGMGAPFPDPQMAMDMDLAGAFVDPTEAEALDAMMAAGQFPADETVPFNDLPPEMQQDILSASDAGLPMTTTQQDLDELAMGGFAPDYVSTDPTIPIQPTAMSAAEQALNAQFAASMGGQMVPADEDIMGGASLPPSAPIAQIPSIDFGGGPFVGTDAPTEAQRLENLLNEQLVEEMLQQTPGVQPPMNLPPGTSLTDIMAGASPMIDVAGTEMAQANQALSAADIAATDPTQAADLYDIMMAGTADPVLQRNIVAEPSGMAAGRATELQQFREATDPMDITDLMAVSELTQQPIVAPQSAMSAAQRELEAQFKAATDPMNPDFYDVLSAAGIPAPQQPIVAPQSEIFSGQKAVEEEFAANLEGQFIPTDEDIMGGGEFVSPTPFISDIKEFFSPKAPSGPSTIMPEGSRARFEHDIAAELENLSEEVVPYDPGPRGIAAGAKAIREGKEAESDLPLDSMSDYNPPGGHRGRQTGVLLEYDMEYLKEKFIDAMNSDNPDAAVKQLIDNPPRVKSLIESTDKGDILRPIDEDIVQDIFNRLEKDYKEDKDKVAQGKGKPGEAAARLERNPYATASDNLEKLQAYNAIRKKTDKLFVPTTYDDISATGDGTDTQETGISTDTSKWMGKSAGDTSEKFGKVFPPGFNEANGDSVRPHPDPTRENIWIFERGSGKKELPVTTPAETTAAASKSQAPISSVTGAEKTSQEYYEDSMVSGGETGGGELLPADDWTRQMSNQDLFFSEFYKMPGSGTYDALRNRGKMWNQAETIYLLGHGLGTDEIGDVTGLRDAAPKYGDRFRNFSRQWLNNPQGYLDDVGASGNTFASIVAARAQEAANKLRAFETNVENVWGVDFMKWKSENPNATSADGYYAEGQAKNPGRSLEDIEKDWTRNVEAVSLFHPYFGGDAHWRNVYKTVNTIGLDPYNASAIGNVLDMVANSMLSQGKTYGEILQKLAGNQMGVGMRGRTYTENNQNNLESIIDSGGSGYGE